MDSTPDARIRLDVIDACNAIAWHADRKDWPRLLAVFAGWRGHSEQLTATAAQGSAA